MDVIWTLGCDDLNGDTASSWVCIMLGMLIFLPFYAIFEAGQRAGLIVSCLAIPDHENGRRYLDPENSPFRAQSAIGLQLLFIPL